MLNLTSAEVRANLADIIQKVRLTKQRAVVTRYGQALVAIVPIEDLDRLGRLDGKPVQPVELRPRRR